MRTYTVVFDEAYGAAPAVPRGEALATGVRVDCRPALAHWPDAVFAVIVRRADGKAYPGLVGARAEAGYLHYALTAQDTAIEGPLALEIQAMQGDALAKSWQYALTIEPSLVPGDAPPPPEPVWVDTVVMAAGDAETARVGAEQAAVAAREDVAAFETDEAGRVANEAQRQAAETRREAEMHTAVARVDEAVILAESAAERAIATADEAMRLSHETAEEMEAFAADETVRVEAELDRELAEAARQFNEGARQANTAEAIAGANDAAGEARSAAQTALAQVEAALEELPEGGASGLPYARRGNPVAVTAVGGSELAVVADEETTVHHDGQAHAAYPGIALALTALDGENVITADSGEVLVTYLRPAAEAEAASAPVARDAGAVAAVRAVEGTPLVLGVMASARQAEGPLPDDPKEIRPQGMAQVAHRGRNLWVHPQERVNNGVTLVPLADGRLRYEGRAGAGGAYFAAVLHTRVPGGTVTLAVGNPVATQQGTITLYDAVTDTAVAVATSTAYTVATVSVAGITEIRIQTPANATMNGRWIRPLLVAGDAAGEYAPPMEDRAYGIDRSGALGLAGLADEVYADGRVLRRTAVVALRGTADEVFTYEINTNTAYGTMIVRAEEVRRRGAEIAQPGGGVAMLCTHLPYGNGGTVVYRQRAENCFCGVADVGDTVAAFQLTFERARVGGAATAGQMRAWLASQAEGGTPVQVVYARQTPVWEQVGSTFPVPALEGVNVIYEEEGAEVLIEGVARG